MGQKSNTKAKGLYKFYNELNLPEGSLIKADNVVIDKDDIIEPRRGIKLYGDAFGSAATRAKQLLQYKNRLLIHHGTTLSYDSDGAGTLAAFNGTYSELESGLRIKYQEAKGNLYFTTNTGIKQISATSSSEFLTSAGYIVDVGVPRALDLQVTCDYSNTDGFLEADNVTAYRIVWGYKDVNGNLHLGAPSEYTLVNNIATVGCVTSLTFTIPSELINNTNYFYQVYRSANKTPATSTPDDEMYLVFEEFPDSTDFSNGYVVTSDITPEDLRSGGAYLYTNSISGEGILQKNDRPPVAKDLALFNDSMFYANTYTRHQKALNLISLTGFVSGTSKLYIGNDNQTTAYTFVGKTQVQNIVCLADVANSLDGKYFYLYSANDERAYYVWFNTSGGSAVDPAIAGKIEVEVAITTGDSANNVATALAAALDALDDFSCPAPGAATITITLAKNGNATDAVDSAVPTGFTFSVPSVQGDGEDTANKHILLSSEASLGNQLEETAKSLVKVINRNSSEVVYAYYISGTEDIPGLILFENKSLNDVPFYIGGNSAISTKFSPVLPTFYNDVTVTLGNPTSINIGAPHGYSSGATVVISDNTGVTPTILGTHTITTTGANTLTIPVTTTVGGTCDIFLGSVESDNETNPNRLYYSKTNEPEAVPSVNFFDVGEKDQSILRIIALRDSLFILKSNAIYRLSGNDPNNFVVSLFDSSSKILAPDTACVLNNQIYMLSDQGVLAFSDGSAPQVISRSIERDILKVTSAAYSGFEDYSFGLSYESDRAYLIFLPTETTDTYATQCFRYNTFTRSWTRFDIAKTCGLINEYDDKMYLGAADTNYIEQERKNFNRTDYADREYSKSFAAGTIVGTNMKISSLTNVAVHDVIAQEQFITVYRFNSILEKLDNDTLLTDTDYASTLTIEAGDDLAAFLSALVAKVDADDTTASYTVPTGSTFADILTDWNTFVGELNGSSGVTDTDYPTYSASDAITYEGIISAINTNMTQITVEYALPFFIGSATLYKAITSDSEWGPDHLGDPSVMKRVTEATLMFDQLNFSHGTIYFRTDLSAYYEEVDFNGEGNGSYGTQTYGYLVYGGNANERPFRTYIPRNKMRNRFITIRFKHNTARESYALNGYSLKYHDRASYRAYRS